MIEVTYQGQILAMILRADFRQEGIRFFTPDSFSQQFAYMHHPQGHVIPPHDHNPVPRTIEWTHEVLFVKSGKVRLDLYTPGDRAYLESHVLLPGDVVLLAHGGHGFVMLEASEMVEVKQGPYAGTEDKVRFAPVAEEKIHIRD